MVSTITVLAQADSAVGALTAELDNAVEIEFDKLREFPDVRRESAYRNGATGGKTERMCHPGAVALKAAIIGLDVADAEKGNGQQFMRT